MKVISTDYFLKHLIRILIANLKYYKLAVFTKSSFYVVLQVASLSDGEKKKA